MLERKKIHELNDFFLTLNARQEKGIYFYRINAYNEQIHAFIRKFYEKARVSGAFIQGRIPNPDKKNLSYYEEIMGMNFKLEMGFLTASLAKWLPRINGGQRNQLAAALYDCLYTMQQAGKNDNMLKNAYIKFMCWLYYKFERIVSHLGENELPKILYEGDISNYELMLFQILSGCGCDIILLQYHGDGNYRKLDMGSSISDDLILPGMKQFPDDFNIEAIQKEIQSEETSERLYGKRPAVLACTNAWITGKGLIDCKTSIADRGQDPKLFYNCFLRISGVEDKTTYLNELYQFQLELKNKKRKILILESGIAKPAPEEIGAIRRGNYSRYDQMLSELSQNIRYAGSMELQHLMKQSFLDVLLEEAKLPDMNVNKLMNRAVYLLCWLKRYQGDLFKNWQMPEIACFILFGGCRDVYEELFVKFLAGLPADVILLVPDLNSRCILKDKKLYEIHYETSMTVKHFPRENAEIQMGTAAYHAERELDSMMYQDSGIYRNRQYDRAISVTLRTMYEEIPILWDKELKYRPNFSTVDDVVNVPVIFAKVSGVKERQMPRYWTEIKSLLTEDTLLIKEVPYISSAAPNPMRAYAPGFLKNGKVQRSKIRSHPQYPYGVLRDEVQEHIFDKLQLLIDQKTIKGTFVNGMEYTITAAILNLPQEIVRLIQQFDFTRKNPKLIFINVTEHVISLEDSIMAAFLNLIGFDILFFVPTGYQTIEKYFDRDIIEEHQIGDYVYDLHIPDFGMVSGNRQRSGQQRASLWDKIFKRNGG